LFKYTTVSDEDDDDDDDDEDDYDDNDELIIQEEEEEVQIVPQSVGSEIQMTSHTYKPYDEYEHTRERFDQEGDHSNILSHEHMNIHHEKIIDETFENLSNIENMNDEQEAFSDVIPVSYPFIQYI
jgi:hypothetical protein